jgi:hypothetical protein
MVGTIMRENAVLLCVALLVTIVFFSGCINTGSMPGATPTPTPQIVYVVVTVTPTETTASPQQTGTTIEADPALGKRWRYNYEFGDRYDPRSFYRNMSMVFSMDSDGRTNGTITSESGASATITGKWYKDLKTDIFYITPVSCISLDTQWGEVLTPSGQSARWDMNAPDLPGKDNPYHWCDDNGDMYVMKYMAPRTLVEMDYSNDRIAINGITFTSD